ncbi:MAG: SRPBCC domain-containing protein [Ginsengibacter sp.]
MKKGSYTNSFKSSKTPEAVFELLLDIEQWWFGVYEETIQGDSKKINDEFIFKAGDGAHYSKQKLIELIPNKKIVWLVTDSKLTFVGDTGEWTGTRISFDISTEENQTTITFTHDGLVPQIECFRECSNGWTKYLEKLKTNLATDMIEQSIK